MASTYKILGQGIPGLTEYTLYTVPAGGQAVVSTIMAANVTSSDQTFDIFIVPAADGGSASTTQHAIAYGSTIKANTSFSITVGITLSAGDKIRVMTGSGYNVNFTAFGLEIA